MKKEQKIEEKVIAYKEVIENSTFIDRDNAKKTIDQLKDKYKEIGKILNCVLVHIDMGRLLHTHINV